MKKSFSVLRFLPFLFSVLMTVGLITFMGPCVHEDGSAGACFWAGRALTGMGAVLSVQGLCAWLLTKSKAAAGVYLAMIFSAAAAIFTPGGLIALCGMASMRCRAVMQPAAIILSAAVLVLSMINGFREWKRTDEK